MNIHFLYSPTYVFNLILNKGVNCKIFMKYTQNIKKKSFYIPTLLRPPYNNLISIY